LRKERVEYNGLSYAFLPRVSHLPLKLIQKKWA
jgi:hypothetical protein